MTKTLRYIHLLYNIIIFSFQVIIHDANTKQSILPVQRHAEKKT